MSEQQTVMRDAFCFHCGADWSDWPTLTDEQRDEVEFNNPDAEPGRLYDVPRSCPSCGFAYDGEDEEEW